MIGEMKEDSSLIIHFYKILDKFKIGHIPTAGSLKNQNQNQ